MTNNRIDDYYINSLESAVEEGCVLLIGPSAFYSVENDQSLSDKFINAVNDKIEKEKGIVNNDDKKRDDVVSATTRLYSKFGDEDKIEIDYWLNNFWKNEVSIEDYPLFEQISRIKFSSYFYFGYDDLLYKSIQCFDTGADFYDCKNPPPSSIIPKITNTAPPAVFNLFGKIGFPNELLQTADEVVDHIYNFVATHGNKNREHTKSIAAALSKDMSDIRYAVMMGVELSHWYNKLLTLVCTSVKSQRSTLPVFDRSGVEGRFDSPLFFQKMHIYKNLFHNNHSIKKINQLIENLSVEGEYLRGNYTHKIFISYSTSDYILAKKISNLCMRLGFPAYFSHEDKNIDKTWREKALEKIQSAEIFLAVGTKEYFDKSNHPAEAINVEQMKAVELIRKSEMKFIGLNLVSYPERIPIDITLPKKLFDDLHFDPVGGDSQDELLGNVKKLLSIKLRNK